MIAPVYRSTDRHMTVNRFSVNYWLREIKEHGPAVVAAKNFDKNSSERYFRDEALQIHNREQDDIKARRIFWLAVITSALTAIFLIGRVIID